MAIFVLIFCILAHCSSFGAAEKPTTPPPKNQQQIDQLRTQFNNNFSALEKEVQAEHFPYMSIKKRKEEINNVIYKMRFLDRDLSKELVAQREEINKKIAEATKKAINKALGNAETKIKKIQDQNSLAPDLIPQSLKIVDLGLTSFGNALLIMQEGLIEDKKPYVDFMRRFSQDIRTKFNSIIATMHQESANPDNKPQFDFLKSLVNTWITFQEKINEFVTPSAPIAIDTFEDQLMALNQNLNRDSELNQAAHQLNEYFPQDQTALSLDFKIIKELMKLYDTYLVRFEKVSEEFPQVQSEQDLIRQQILISQYKEFEQRLHPVLFQALFRRIEEANKYFLKFAQLDDANKYQEMRPMPVFVMNKLEEETKETFRKNNAEIPPYKTTEWQMISVLIQEIHNLYYRYYEHLDSMTISAENRRSVENAYNTMGEYVKEILLSLETRIKDIPREEYAYLSQDQRNLLLQYPQMYGRILNQYAIITRVLVSMKILQINPENLLNPFKKAQKEIGDILDALEQEYLKQSHIKMPGQDQPAAAAAVGAGAKRKTTAPSADQGAPAMQEPPAKKSRGEDKPQAQYPAAAAGAGAGNVPLSQQSLLPAMKNIAKKAAAAAAQAASEEDMPALEPETPRNARRPAAAAAAASADPDYAPPASAYDFQSIRDVPSHASSQE